MEKSSNQANQQYARNNIEIWPASAALGTWCTGNSSRQLSELISSFQALSLSSLGYDVAFLVYPREQEYTHPGGSCCLEDGYELFGPLNKKMQNSQSQKQ